MTQKGAYVFIGPTISEEEARMHCDVTYLPPACQGDVYTISKQRPVAIGIIDGYFTQVPSVWHKEILWAMAHGIHVFGAASMGALRAAELYQYGMRGVGRIFEQYQSGELEDDDEVAVTHLPAEQGYRIVGEALVDIRRTVDDAVVGGAINASFRSRILEKAKNTHFSARSLSSLIEAAETDSPGEAAELRRFAAASSASQKKDDAIEMLREVASLLKHPRHFKATFAFQKTAKWEQFCDLFSGDPGALDELCLQRAMFGEAYAAAFDEMLAEAGRASGPFSIDPDLRRSVALEFRRTRKLLDESDLRAWLAANEISDEDYVRLLNEHARIEGLRRRHHTAIMSRLRKRLPFHEQYRQLVQRAAEKKKTLEAAGRLNELLRPEDIDRDLEWYCAELGIQPPATLGEFARKCGFENDVAFLQALHRERVFGDLTG